MRFFAALLALTLSRLAYAQGGPPLITDDPGTPGDGHWEINIAGQLQSGGGEQLYSFPYVDANYGLGDHIQLKLETGWWMLHEQGGIVSRGAGTALAGVKWRFIDEETSGIAVSTYPQYEFHHFFSSADTSLVNPGNRIVLPIEASKSFGRFALNPEVGCSIGSQVPDQLFYGLVADFEYEKDREVLLELHGTTQFVSGSEQFGGAAGTQLLVNVGMRYAVEEWWSPIAAIGTTVMNFAGAGQQLIAYVGIQLRL